MNQEKAEIIKINYKIFLPVLLMFYTLGQITSDMYVPSMPAITNIFHSSSAAIQWSMSTYMLGFSLSQLVYGVLTDHYGRKPIILVGLAIGIIGTLICFAATSPAILIIGRFIQGTGMGVGITLGGAVSRDLFSGPQLAKIGSIMSIGATILIGIGPILGGYFQHYLGWRSIFGFIAIYSLITCLMVCFFIPETSNPSIQRKKIRRERIFHHFRKLLTTKIFLGSVLCTMLAYAGCLAFYTMSTFLLQDKVGLSPIAYGWSCIVIMAAFLIGSIVNERCVAKIGIKPLMLIATVLMIIAGASMLITALLGYLNIFVIMIPAMIYGFGAAFIMCNAFAEALTPFPYIVGAASALFGCMQIAGGFLATSIIASFKFTSQEPLAIIYLVIGILALLALTQLSMKEK